MRRVAATLVALAAAAGACTGGGEVVDFGPGGPSTDAAVPADRGLDLAEVEPAGQLPPRDAVLADAGWPEVAGWIRRETDAGRPVIVNFFASWCEPCKRELPLLIDVAAAEEEVVFVGVDHQDQRELGQRMVDDYGIDYPTLFDPAGDAAFAVGARGMPTTVAFDRDGRLVARVIGELTPDSLERLLGQVR